MYVHTRKIHKQTHGNLLVLLTSNPICHRLCPFGTKIYYLLCNTRLTRSLKETCQERMNRKVVFCNAFSQFLLCYTYEHYTILTKSWKALHVDAALNLSDTHRQIDDALSFILQNRFDVVDWNSLTSISTLNVFICIISSVIKMAQGVNQFRNRQVCIGLWFSSFSFSNPTPSFEPPFLSWIKRKLLAEKSGNSGVASTDAFTCQLIWL